MVLLEKNKAYKVQGMELIKLKMFDNQEMLLQEVRCVPELKRNLLSINMFDLMNLTTKNKQSMA